VAGLALVGCGDDDDDDDAAVADAFAGRLAPRRVVTGVDEDGKSYFVHDAETPGHLNSGFFVIDELWIDDPSRPDPEATEDPAEDPQPLAFARGAPRDGGSLFRTLTFKPGGGFAGAMSDTIDYGIVLSGEIEFELDAGVVQLTAGDVVVQRGARPAYRNKSDEDCIMAFILIGSPNYA
jgi:quercetin dioxygenase-like cupin family protein